MMMIEDEDKDDNRRLSEELKARRVWSKYRCSQPS